MITSLDKLNMAESEKDYWIMENAQRNHADVERRIENIKLSEILRRGNLDEVQTLYRKILNPHYSGERENSINEVYESIQRRRN